MAGNSDCGQLGPAPGVVRAAECVSPVRKRPRAIGGEEALELEARIRRCVAEEFQRRDKDGAEVEAEGVRRIVAEELDRHNKCLYTFDATSVEAEVSELKTKFAEFEQRNAVSDAELVSQAEMREFKLKFNSVVEDIRRSFTAQTEVLRERNEKLTDQVEAARGEQRRLRAELESYRSVTSARSPAVVSDPAKPSLAPAQETVVAPPAPVAKPAKPSPSPAPEAVVAHPGPGTSGPNKEALPDFRRAALPVITFAAGGGTARSEAAGKKELLDPTPVGVDWKAPAVFGGSPCVPTARGGRFRVADCHLMTLAKNDTFLLGGPGAAAAWEVGHPSSFAVTFKVGGWGFGDSAAPPFFVGVAPAGVDLKEAWPSTVATLPAPPPPPKWAHWTLEIDPDSRPGSVHFPPAVQRGAFFAFHRVRLRSGAAYSRMPYASYQLLAGGMQPSEHEWSHESSGNGPTSIRVQFTRHTGGSAEVEFTVYRQKDTVAAWKLDLARHGLDPSAEYQPTIFFAESMSANVDEAAGR